MSGRKSKLLCSRSNSAARSKAAAMCVHSAALASIVWSSDQPVGTTDESVAVVTESPLAKRVTSWPRATRPSVSNEANSSQGP